MTFDAYLIKRTSEEVYAFRGIYSEANPMSNWYKRKFMYKNKRFTSSEAVYKYEEAMKANGVSVAKLIQITSSVNRPERKIQGLNLDSWKSKREQVMADISYRKV